MTCCVMTSWVAGFGPIHGVYSQDEMLSTGLVEGVEGKGARERSERTMTIMTQLRAPQAGHSDYFDNLWMETSLIDANRSVLHYPFKCTHKAMTSSAACLKRRSKMNHDSTLRLQMLKYKRVCRE